MITNGGYILALHGEGNVEYKWVKGAPPPDCVIPGWENATIMDMPQVSHNIEVEFNDN